MEARNNAIELFFAGDLRYEDAVKEEFRKRIAEFTNRQFALVYREAMRTYVEGQTLKDYLTLSVSFWCRLFKSSCRIPENLRDVTPQEALKTFLTGAGGVNRNSFKYCFLEAFLLTKETTVVENDLSVISYFYRAKTDRQAKNLIDMTLAMLNQKEPLLIAAV